MKKWVALMVLAWLCLGLGTGFADTLWTTTDVYHVTEDGTGIEILDILDAGTPYSILDWMTTDGHSPFDTRFDTSAPIVWIKIAYTNINGVASEGWVVSNPEVIKEVIFDDQEWNGYPSITGQGFVLCESLTMRERPEFVADVVTTLPYGATGEIRDGGMTWINMAYGAPNGYTYEGWVRTDYVLVDPAYYTPAGETAVYAYPSADAKRVGLIDAGTSYAIIAELEDYYVISLRGASGFVKK